MAQTTARVKKGGNNFEILVDLEEALKVKKGEGNLEAAVLTDAIFTNLKAGEHAATDVLEVEFGSADVMAVAERIIKNGEIVMPTDYIHKQKNERYKQVVDFLVKNVTDENGRPYTPDRIMMGLREGNVNVKNKPIEEQVAEIIEQLQRILPVKFEVKKIKVTIPAQHTGKAYGVINDFKKSEEWLSNGDLVAMLEIPAGLIMDFYDKLNGVTHGAGLAEELK